VGESALSVAKKTRSVRGRVELRKELKEKDPAAFLQKIKVSMSRQKVATKRGLRKERAASVWRSFFEIA